MSDVLSQGEIDALLAAISSGDVDADEIREVEPEKAVKPFDFLRPNKFSKDQLRTIELLHDGFCRETQNQWTAQMRAKVEVDVLSADQMGYGEFVNSLPAPTLAFICSMEPLEGNVLLELNLPLAFSLIERLVGGPGTARPKVRELTEIEMALLSGPLNSLLAALSDSWSTVVEATFAPLGSETNPQFAQIVAPSEIVVLVTFSVTVGEHNGMVSLCIPHIVIEPAMGRLTAQSYFSGSAAGELPDARAEIERGLDRVEIPISARLGGATLSVEDLMDLAPGDVIPLGAPPGSEASVRIGHRPAFLAQPGVSGRKAAVQVTRKLDDFHEGAQA